MNPAGPSGQNHMPDRVVIVGAGAVGGYVGAHLARVGVDVVLIDAWPMHVEAIQRDGLYIKAMEPADTFRVRARAIHVCDVQQLIRERPFNVALISVKSYDTEWATSLIVPYLSIDACVVSMQNSINEERLAAIVGWRRTLGCSVNLLASELVSPGCVVRNSPLGDEQRIGLLVGEAHGQATARARHIADMLSAADSAGVTTNLWGERWSKLTINSMRNGVCAMTGLSSRERDTDPRSLSLSIRLGSQSVRVGRALGLTLNPALGGMDLDLLGRAEQDPAAMRAIAGQIVSVLHKRAEEQRPSMGQDIRKGRRTETDEINGLVARRGAEVGVDATLHDRVNTAILEIERGKLYPSPALLDDFKLLPTS